MIWSKYGIKILAFLCFPHHLKIQILLLINSQNAPNIKTHFCVSYDEEEKINASLCSITSKYFGKEKRKMNF